MGGGRVSWQPPPCGNTAGERARAPASAGQHQRRRASAQRRGQAVGGRTRRPDHPSRRPGEMRRPSACRPGRPGSNGRNRPDPHRRPQPAFRGRSEMNAPQPLHGSGPVLCVVGARPNFIKMGPIMRAFAGHPSAQRAVLVHTGQHYDAAMSDQLFADLGLPTPDVNLGVGSGSQSEQTAKILLAFEPLIDQYKPGCVLVVGDVNSTLACSLVAAKRGVPIAHVEAGLRSFDRSMPEEINRVLTDQIADVLYTTERSARDNLLREGIDADRIVFVGNVMIDSLHMHRRQAPHPHAILARLGVPAAELISAGRHGIVTLHRPSNVDTAPALRRVIELLVSASEELPLVWPVHPRTARNIARFGLSDLLRTPRIITVAPLGYLDMLGLMAEAAVAITDSGGLQEETTALGVPCLTVRENTERPITVDEGTNTMVGTDGTLLLDALTRILSGGGKRGRVPELWDGAAAPRIVNDLIERLERRAAVAA